MSATLRHAGYVLGENPVTGFAFALFLLFVWARHSARYWRPTIHSRATPRKR